MIHVGHVKEIWRYPVKGMAGERLETCLLGERGVQGDRTWALRDVVRKEIQSCKFRPQLLLCTARDRSDGTGSRVDVTFPDGSVVASTDADVHARLSALTGRASTLEALRADSDRDFYRRHKHDDHTWLEELKATFEREEGEPLPDFSQAPPSFADFVSSPGTFFLVTPIHIVTTSTLTHLRNLQPGADWDRRRFRPNFLIEPSPDAEGLVEQGWIGKRIILGGATIDCAGATPRCGAITRALPDLPADRTLLRTVVWDAVQYVGVVGVCSGSASVQAGDPVYMAA
ncbi:MAG: MOSC N-terminal beta barrel domain-containing protein [Parvibaculaceae bacterium]